MASRAECCGSELAGWDHDGSPRHHPLRPGRRGGGGRDPTPASKQGGCSATAGLATCARRSRYPSFAGLRLMRSLPSGRRRRRETADLSVAASWSANRPRFQRPAFGPVERWRHRGARKGRRWPRVRRAANPPHPGRLVPGMATIPPATSAPSRQTDPTSGTGTLTRAGRRPGQARRPREGQSRQGQGGCPPSATTP
jgi:hypothetical protein